MELKQIKELMAAMGRTGTKKLFLKREDFELQLERDEVTHFGESTSEFYEEPPKQHLSLERASTALSKNRELVTSLAAPTHHESARQEETTSLFVTSPMVGTFYISPTPGEAAFVKVGDKIEKNTIVCIIEAMKVMNEVKSMVSGTVIEILVEDGHPVEFGTKLFRIS